MNDIAVDPARDAVERARADTVMPPARAAVVRARTTAARGYLVQWRPAVFTVAMVLALVATLVHRDAARPGVLVVLALFVVVSWGAAVAVRLGAAALTVALVVTIIDLPLVAAWAIETRSAVGEGLSGMLGVVLVAAWLLGPRIALSTGAMAVAIILGIWFVDGPWSAPQIVPDVAWVVAGGTVVAVAIATSAERALREIAEANDRSQTALHELTSMRRRLVADVSHELRTPLTTINGFLDTILREDLTLDEDERRELLLEARRGGARLEHLVSRLLTVERTGSGDLPMVVERHDAMALVERAVELVEVPADRTIRIESFQPDDDHAAVLADERRIVELVRAIVENAVEHGSGEVLVLVTQLGPVLRIDVCDDGPGLPPGTEQHAFEPFTTFGTHHGAAGLGLATGRAYAVAHGGSLDYVADCGNGRHAFRLLLPLARTF
jgi:signal transduction histidine kinase